MSSSSSPSPSSIPRRSTPATSTPSSTHIVFTDGVLPNLTPAVAQAPLPPPEEQAETPRAGFGRQPSPESIPEEYRPWLGVITTGKTLPQLTAFVENGGTLLTIGSSSRIYGAMRLPVKDALTEVVKGKEQPVPSERFYIPGSLLRAQVDNTQPVAYGMPSSVDVFYDNSPAFKAAPDAGSHGLKAIAWYGDGTLLDSGWAWGQTYLNDSIAVAQANVGKGKVLLFGTRSRLPRPAPRHLQIPLQRRPIRRGHTSPIGSNSITARTN